MVMVLSDRLSRKCPESARRGARLRSASRAGPNRWWPPQPSTTGVPTACGECWFQEMQAESTDCHLLTFTRADSSSGYLAPLPCWHKGLSGLGSFGDMSKAFRGQYIAPENILLPSAGGWRRCAGGRYRGWAAGGGRRWASFDLFGGGEASFARTSRTLLSHSDFSNF